MFQFKAKNIWLTCFVNTVYISQTCCTVMHVWLTGCWLNVNVNVNLYSASSQKNNASNVLKCIFPSVKTDGKT